MAAQKVLHAGIEKEAQEDLTREAQDRDEGHQRTAGAANRQMAKMAPIDLAPVRRAGCAAANRLPPAAVAGDRQ